MAIRTKTLRRLLALFLGALMISASPGAYAQEDPFSEFFGGLFGGRPHRSSPDYGEPRVRRIAPGRERGPAYWHGQSEQRRAKRQQTPAPAEETPAVEPTFFVATLGDTLGVLLANGLKQGLSDKPDVAILSKAKESSGLAREDFYDWKKAAHEIAGDAQKVNVAVIMLGSNDRQAIQQGSESYEPFSPRWREIYAARVDAVIAAFQEKGIPVIWVGLPVMKNERFSADMAQLNEIFRARVEKAGAAYIDIWEAMADEHGQYSAFGPDINGQIVKLRSADGVHFTDAGARSVAHFVDTEIKRIYDEYRERTPLNAAAPPAAAPPPDAGAR
ncbi:SGNH family hydrolase, partial [Methylocystis sp. 9N]